MKRSRVFVVMSLALPAGAALAHPPFEALPPLTGYARSVAWAMDGIGAAYGSCAGGPPEVPTRAMLWAYGQGILPIPSGPSLIPMIARGVSRQGGDIVGTSADGNGFVWRTGQTSPEALLPAGIDGLIEPRGVATMTGGWVIVGTCHTPDGKDAPFTWPQAGAFAFLPPLPSGELNGSANGVSRDGYAIVGRMFSPDVGGGQAVLWTSAGAVGLGWLGSGESAARDSTAIAVNGTHSTGLWVAGFSTGGRLTVSAFRYSPGLGMVEVPALPGAVESRAYDIDLNGNTVVGDCVFADGHHEAFLWDRWLGTCNLRQAVLAGGGAIPDGWMLEYAAAVTDSGAVIVGTGRDPAGTQMAYFARPKRCFANCDLSTSAPRLNVSDFACFISRFAAGEDYANCDHSTTPPTLNVLDFMCFVDKYVSGCSGL